MPDRVPMTSNRPYLIRAIHAWVIDNACTPYLLVDAAADGVAVPDEHVEDGRIVLNISPGAADRLELGDQAIQFNARFGGRPTQVFVPIAAFYLKEPPRLDYLWAGLCLCGAAYFLFRGGLGVH